MSANSFRDWQKIAAEILRTVGGVTAERYAANGRLEHYAGLSNDILERFQNVPLARAAFLHGIDVADLAALEQIPNVTAEVRSLLDDRTRLRAVGTGGFGGRHRPEFVRPVLTTLLRTIHDPRAMLLFVLEQLRHLDEWGAVAAWQQRFVNAPEPFPFEKYIANPGDRFGSQAERAEFLRHVVAPVAEEIGLWQERNLALNLAFLATNETTFAQTVSIILDAAATDAAAPLVNAVALTVPSASVRWQWRHVESAFRRYRAERTERRAWRPERAGYVLVECATREACYVALGHIHAAFAHVPEAFRDLSRRNQPGPYAAIHTKIVVDAAQPRSAGNLISVHVIDAASERQRLAFADARHLPAIETLRSDNTAKHLRTIAFDGRVYYLPHDATILDFAYAVHSGFLAHLSGAQVNGRRVPVLHRLRDGDVVWLDIAKAFQPLPDNWQSSVSAGRKRKLEQAYASALRPALIEEGRRWLRNRIAAAAEIELLDEQLDALLSDVNRAVLPKTLHHTSAILMQLGLVDQRERGITPVRTITLPEGAAESLAEAVRKRIRGVRLVTDFDLPEALRATAERITVCTNCLPRSEEDLVVTRHGTELVVHRKWAACADASAVPVERHERPVSRQYYVIETTNRSGVGVDIFTVFRNRGVDIEEIAARRLGSGWSVVRCGIDFASLPRRTLVTADLRRIPGVRRVIDPDGPIVPLLEDPLPHRGEGMTTLWTKAPPYQVGPGLLDDHLFYGMEAELGALEQAFRLTAEAGQIVFIQGPLRTGKTSIARKFLRVRNADHHRPSVGIYEFAQGKSWSEVVPSVIAALQLQSDLSEQPADSIEGWIREYRKHDRLPLILVIDEAVGVFATATATEANAIRAFADAVRRSPGVLVVLVGPLAGVRYTSNELAHILQTALAVPSRSLSGPEVRDMLRATKLASTYSIAVPEGVSSAVYYLTRGNPYWVAELANLMFSLNESGVEATEIAYTRELLEQAVAWALRRGIVFLDRRAQTDDERAILRVILRYPLPSSVLPTNKLFDETNVDRSLSRSRFDDALEQLEQRGTVQFADRRWQITAPLLEQYLRRELERST